MIVVCFGGPQLTYFIAIVWALCVVHLSMYLGLCNVFIRCSQVPAICSGLSHHCLGCFGFPVLVNADDYVEGFVLVLCFMIWSHALWLFNAFTLPFCDLFKDFRWQYPW